MKVYFITNKRNYALSVRQDSWRVDPVTDLSIGIDPEWGDDSVVELP